MVLLLLHGFVCVQISSTSFLATRWGDDGREVELKKAIGARNRVCDKFYFSQCTDHLHANLGNTMG